MISAHQHVTDADAGCGVATLIWLRRGQWAIRRGSVTIQSAEKITRFVLISHQHVTYADAGGGVATLISEIREHRILIVITLRTVLRMGMGA